MSWADHNKRFKNWFWRADAESLNYCWDMLKEGGQWLYILSTKTYSTPQVHISDYCQAKNSTNKYNLQHLWKIWVKCEVSKNRVGRKVCRSCFPEHPLVLTSCCQRCLQRHWAHTGWSSRGAQTWLRLEFFPWFPWTAVPLKARESEAAGYDIDHDTPLCRFSYGLFCP